MMKISNKKESQLITPPSMQQTVTQKHRHHQIQRITKIIIVLINTITISIIRTIVIIHIPTNVVHLHREVIIMEVRKRMATAAVMEVIIKQEITMKLL